MSTAGSVQKKDPVMRQLNIGVTILWIGIIIAAAVGLHDGIGALSNNKTASTQNVQVCPNTQPPFTKADWARAQYTYPPSTGIYKVTYAEHDDSLITSIELVSTDISACS